MKVKSALSEAWRQAPAQNFRLIVRVSDEGSEEALRDRGCQVLRRCKLIHGFVVQCTGEQATALSEASWVTDIERDEPVQAWLGPDKAS